MIKKYFLGLFLFVSFVSYPLYTNAVTVKQLTLQQMVGLSDRIFRGTVSDVRVAEDENGKIVDYVTFNSLDWIKGDGNATVVIKQPARIREAGATGTTFASHGNDLPEYKLGKTYLVLLSADSEVSGFTAPIGLKQGLVALENQGGRWVAPSLNKTTPLLKSLSSRGNDYDSLKSVIVEMLD